MIEASLRARFNDNDIRDRTRNRQVSGKRACHGQCQPDRVRVRKSSDERLQQHYRGHVAHQVRQHGRGYRKDTETLQIETLAETQQMFGEANVFRSTDDQKEPDKKDVTVQVLRAAAEAEKARQCCGDGCVLRP